MGIRYQFATADNTMTFVYDNNPHKIPWNPKLNRPLDAWGGEAMANWISRGKPAPAPYDASYTPGS